MNIRSVSRMKISLQVEITNDKIFYSFSMKKNRESFELNDHKQRIIRVLIISFYIKMLKIKGYKVLCLIWIGMIQYYLNQDFGVVVVLSIDRSRLTFFYGRMYVVFSFGTRNQSAISLGRTEMN